MAVEEEWHKDLSDSIRDEMDMVLLKHIRLEVIFDQLVDGFTREDIDTDNGRDEFVSHVSYVLQATPYLWSDIIDTVWAGNVRSRKFYDVIHDDNEFFNLIPIHVYRQQFEERFDSDFYALIPEKVKGDPDFKRFVNVLKLKRGEMK